MAFVERRGKWYRIIFRYASPRYTHTLKTTKRAQADAVEGGIEKTLMLMEQNVLDVPDGVGVITFVLNNGDVKASQDGQNPSRMIF